LRAILHTREGLDIGDEGEKMKVKDLNAEFEPLTKLMKKDEKMKVKDLKAEFEPLTKLMKEVLAARSRRRS